MFLMRDEKEERSKQGQTNKQGKATQHVHVHINAHGHSFMYMYVCTCILLIPQDMSYNPAVDTINGMLIWAELILSHMRHDKMSRHTMYMYTCSKN